MHLRSNDCVARQSLMAHRSLFSRGEPDSVKSAHVLRVRSTFIPHRRLEAWIYFLTISHVSPLCSGPWAQSAILKQPLTTPGGCVNTTGFDIRMIVSMFNRNSKEKECNEAKISHQEGC